MPDIYAELRSSLPSSYVDYIESHNGWEGFLGSDDEHVVLWEKEAIQENYAGYEIRECLNPRWFAFGSNGGGEMLCFDLESETDAVYLLPFMGMSAEEPILMHQSFSEMAWRIERPA